MNKVRLDIACVERGLFESRHKAQAAIMAGLVLVNEKEADKAAEKLKRKAFSTNMELAQKFHLRYFALHIDSLADCAEDVADRLSIYTIKRSV